MKMSCRRDYFHTRLASFELGGAKAYRSNKEVFARVESGRDNRCQKPRPEARVPEGRMRPPRTSALPLALIHSSAWKGNSANFAVTEFSEVAPALLTLHT